MECLIFFELKYANDKFNPEEANKELQACFELFIKGNLAHKEDIIDSDKKIKSYIDLLNASARVISLNADYLKVSMSITSITILLSSYQKNTQEYQDFLKEKELKEIEEKKIKHQLEVLEKISHYYSKKLTPILKRKKKKYNFFGWKYKLNKYGILLLVFLLGFGVELLIDAGIVKLDEHLKEEKITLFGDANIYLNKINSINFHGVTLIHIFFFVIAFIFTRIWWKKRIEKIFLTLYKRNFSEGIAYLEVEVESFFDWMEEHTKITGEKIKDVDFDVNTPED